jgi:allantoate deiminase
MSPAERLMKRIEALAEISEEAGRLTRTFASPAMRRANELVAGWMREAGMSVRQDAIGNLIGHYRAAQREGKILLLGSHLDSVRDAGKFDGPLGVLAAIAGVQQLHEAGKHLPFAIEVIGFADEEGVRYHSTYLGSKAVAGTFDLEVLNRTDAAGVRMADAIRTFGGDPAALAEARFDPSRLLGYFEIHIEQGPVLEKHNLPVGIVTGIAGQTRAEFQFTGMAGHAGTVPMMFRRDALCAAAEFVLAVEAEADAHPGLVATVGQISVEPGAGNVIPGAARLSLDFRHPDDISRETSWVRLRECAEDIGQSRNVGVEFKVVHHAQTVACAERFTKLLEQAVKGNQGESFLLPSGAGHDAAALAAITPVAMLFVRCQGGISHHPDESATSEDIAVALAVLNDFLAELAHNHE